MATCDRTQSGRKHSALFACSPEFFAEDANTQTTYNHGMATTRSAVIDSNAIMSNILAIRGHRVLLDSDLPLYIKLRRRR
jgi:hypothetical protein